MSTDKLCRIRDLQRSIAEFETQFEQAFGICMNEGMLLCSLMSTHSLSSGKIASLLGLSCSNTSKVIRSLEKKGLIGRIPGETDKRQMYFSLTPAGQELIAQVKCAELQLPPLLEATVASQ